MRVRTLVFAVALQAACGHDNPAQCPSSGISCSEAGEACQFEEEGGGTAYCTCNGATWSCNDCPDGAPPEGACDSGAACNVWGFENSCACSCGQDGTWSCVQDDPSPNFHCSP